ncbi:uncharacterized protein LOC129944324 [Eupeodes corollae]|uniref:uncharacterized protein LOC129944324 n=1 Tax=Eupeodes corollae TaxID=290404 RepID=UPI0024908ACA|nr:uncharacterized protein LOC129944324 [Eupeodes corollae]
MPCELKTFVANRVSSIQELSGGHRWRHVRSDDNPADLASRGVTAEQLVRNKLWWHGPSWLVRNEDDWPGADAASIRQQPEEALKELKAPVVASARITKPAVLSVGDTSLIESKSTLQSILRITAFILRFVRNCKKRNNHQKTLPVTSVPLVSLEERDGALAYWARTEQHRAYHKEMQQLSQESSLEVSSSIISLNPFLDNKGTMRVGLRLQNSVLSYEIVHPIIVPARSTLSKLLIREAHLKTLHGGVQLCMHYIRHKFWIPTSRRAVKTYISRCITCFRQIKATSEQLMGSLPRDRVQPTRAFKHSGVDYAGPVQIKARSGRSKVVEKGYIAVFVCMVTKAIHLEPVSNLTSSAFLAAFQRFTGRRGACSVLWSDNATNFVEAYAELKRNGEQWKDRLPIEQVDSLGTE